MTFTSPFWKRTMKLFGNLVNTLSYVAFYSDFFTSSGVS